MNQDFDASGRRTRLEIWYPEMPPTSNLIYFKGTRLTEKARDYRERFKMYVVQNYLHQFGEMPQPNKLVKSPETGDMIPIETEEPNLIFGLQLVFYLDLLTSWGVANIPASRRAKFRFKKVDLTNRIKFMEDCFKYSMDIDDSLTFESTQRKIHSPDREAVYLHYYMMPVEMVNVQRVPGGTF